MFDNQNACGYKVNKLIALYTEEPDVYQSHEVRTMYNDEKSIIEMICRLCMFIGANAKFFKEYNNWITTCDGLAHISPFDMVIDNNKHIVTTDLDIFGNLCDDGFVSHQISIARKACKDIERVLKEYDLDTFITIKPCAIYPDEYAKVPTDNIDNHDISNYNYFSHRGIVARLTIDIKDHTKLNMLKVLVKMYFNDYKDYIFGKIMQPLFEEQFGIYITR